MTLALSETADSPATSASFVARRLGNLDDPFVAIAGRWAVSPFHTPAFLKVLDEQLCRPRGAELVLIAVSDAHKNPVALFPFTRGRHNGFTVIEGLGHSVADYYVPLTHPDLVLDAAEAQAMWRAVRAQLPAADQLWLKNIPRQALGQAHALSNAAFLEPMGHSATTVVIRNEANELTYDIKALSVNKPLRKWVRRLEGDIGAVSFRAAETPEEIDALLQVMVAYRLERFADLNRPDMLADPNVVAFYRELALPKQGPALARVYGLVAGDEVIGVIYGMPQGDTFTSLISSMSTDQRYARVSPGIMAMYFAINDCVERGNRAYDLSVGELSYKGRYGGELVELFEYREARSLKGWWPTTMAKLRTRARLFRKAHPELIEKFKRKPAQAAAPETPAAD
jgi:CelD/BcsL family acetyltransferase involved in cellulose biosynthesis